MPDVLLGTCGWSYAEWEGILYPRKQSKLKQYSSVFPTVEIDSTFYRLPEQGMVLGWRNSTPSDFLFSAKLPQTITHEKALDPRRGIEEDLNNFLVVMKPLVEAGKLACILTQLPPSMRFNPERLEAFLIILPEQVSTAVEFRHRSWLNEETFKLLEKYNVAYTIVDEPLLPAEIHVTSKIAYVRWHGRGKAPWFNYRYSEDQLQEWVPKIREVTAKAERVLGYFNNHFHGYAPENCLQMTQILGIVAPHSAAALRRVTLYRKGKTIPELGLETWTGPIASRTVGELFGNFADAETLRQAQLIPNSDVSLRQDNKRALAGYIGDTTVDVNFEDHTIMHYCSKWSQSSLEKRFCPHIAKLFLSIDSGRAKIALSSVASTLDSWKFKSQFPIKLPK